jgi:AcrR family transcriptional regulator
MARVRKKLKLSATDRRAQLIAVGRSVFAKSGYDAASMEEIAREAGVTKPVVYEHFAGKEGLYAVIIDREMAALVQRIAASIATGSPRKRWESAVRAFLTYAKEQPDGFAVLTRDPPSGQTGRGITNVISDLSERVREIFEKELNRAGLDSVVSPIYAHALIGMVVQVGHWWVENPNMSVDQVARYVAAIGWMGLRHIPKNPQLLK